MFQILKKIFGAPDLQGDPNAQAHAPKAAHSYILTIIDALASGVKVYGLGHPHHRTSKPAYLRKLLTKHRYILEKKPIALVLYKYNGKLYIHCQYSEPKEGDMIKITYIKLITDCTGIRELELYETQQQFVFYNGTFTPSVEGAYSVKEVFYLD